MMLEKVRTAYWFAQRPSHWAHALALFERKFKHNHDSAVMRKNAQHWAEERATSLSVALSKVGLNGSATPPALDETILQRAKERAEDSKVAMGGPGDLSLIYAAIRLSEAKSLVETGVAYGWSSLAILAAIRDRPDAKLVSVDMPYPKAGNEPYVGIVIPMEWKENWILLREPDRRGLEKAIHLLNGEIDFCHYDSDKSWWGRAWAYPLLWQALRPGGIFISDDIQDNLYFARFTEQTQVAFAVVESNGKFVGIMRKPI